MYAIDAAVAADVAAADDDASAVAVDAVAIHPCDAEVSQQMPDAPTSLCNRGRHRGITMLQPLTPLTYAAVVIFPLNPSSTLVLPLFCPF